ATPRRSEMIERTDHAEFAEKRTAGAFGSQRWNAEGEDAHERKNESLSVLSMRRRSGPVWVAGVGGGPGAGPSADRNAAADHQGRNRLRALASRRGRATPPGSGPGPGD